jgi:hypothetical protein
MRVLQAADRAVVVRLLGPMLSIVPGWVWVGVNLSSDCCEPNELLEARDYVITICSHQSLRHHA